MLETQMVQKMIAMSSTPTVVGSRLHVTASQRHCVRRELSSSIGVGLGDDETDDQLGDVDDASDCAAEELGRLGRSTSGRKYACGIE